MKGVLHHVAKDLKDGLAPLLDEIFVSLETYLARYAARRVGWGA